MLHVGNSAILSQNSAKNGIVSWFVAMGQKAPPLFIHYYIYKRKPLPDLLLMGGEKGLDIILECGRWVLGLGKMLSPIGRKVFPSWGNASLLSGETAGRLPSKL